MTKEHPKFTIKKLDPSYRKVKFWRSYIIIYDNNTRIHRFLNVDGDQLYETRYNFKTTPNYLLQNTGDRILVYAGFTNYNNKFYPIEVASLDIKCIKIKSAIENKEYANNFHPKNKDYESSTSIIFSVLTRDYKDLCLYKFIPGQGCVSLGKSRGHGFKGRLGFYDCQFARYDEVFNGQRSDRKLKSKIENGCCALYTIISNTEELDILVSCGIKNSNTNHLLIQCYDPLNNKLLWSENERVTEVHSIHVFDSFFIYNECIYDLRRANLLFSVHDSIILGITRLEEDEHGEQSYVVWIE